MKINRASLIDGKTVTLEDDIDFSSFVGDSYHLKKINKAHAKAKITQYDELLKVDLSVTADALVVCSYSLEDFIYHVTASDSLMFTDNEEDSDNIYVKENIVDLDEYILSLIVTNIPIKTIKPGAKLPNSGEGYRIIDENTYEEEKKKKKSSPFDVLDNLDLEDK